MLVSNDNLKTLVSRPVVMSVPSFVVSFLFAILSFCEVGGIGISINFRNYNRIGKSLEFASI